MPKYRGDPRWITTLYPDKCARCGRQIAQRERAFYYPIGRAVYCDAPSCGEEASAEFFAAASDEDRNRWL